MTIVNTAWKINQQRESLDREYLAKPVLATCGLLARYGAKSLENGSS